MNISSLDAPALRRPTAFGQAVTRLRRTWQELGTVVPQPADAAFDLKFVLIVERSRRCERPFAVTQFVPQSGVVDPAWAHRFVRAAALQVRACDAAGIVGGRAVVVWDDSDRPGGSIAAKRLAEAIREHADAEIAATVVFPDDGYTPAALFRCLDEQAREGLG